MAEKEKKVKNRKKLKYGATATAVTILFIAAVVLLNVVVNAIGGKTDLKFDLTSAKIYEISDETADYLKSLDTEVEMGVTYKEEAMQSNEMMKLIYETIEKYASKSDKIKTTYFDTTEDPDILNKFKEGYNGEIAAGDIVIKSGNRVKTVSMNDMFETDSSKMQYYYYGQLSYRDCITAFKGEQELTSAVMSVTDADPKNVALIGTSNGSPIFASANQSAYSSLQTLFDDNGYAVTEVDIVTDEISPETYDIAVLPAPQNDLTPEAVAKLGDFLANDGNYNKQLLYIADYTQGSTPNLDEFLETWGLSFDSSVVVETNAASAVAMGQTSYPVATITDETYSEGLSNTSNPIVAALAKPIDILWDANNDRTTGSMLSTSKTSVRYPLSATGEDKKEEFDVNSAPQSEQVIMAKGVRTAAITKTTEAGTTSASSTVFALGSMAMVTLASSASLNNGEFLINAMNIACGKSAGVTIAAKDMTTTALTVTSVQAQAVKLIVVFVIPAVVICIGIFVFIRRKNK